MKTLHKMVVGKRLIKLTLVSLLLGGILHAAGAQGQAALDVTITTFLLAKEAPPSTGEGVADAFSVVVGDFNEDGHQDLAVTREIGDFAIFLGDGLGGFGEATLFPVGTFLTVVRIGDFNNDGHQDLVIVEANEDAVVVFTGDGQGGFSSPATVAVGDLPDSVTVGDFNEDGNDDLAVANMFSDDVTVLSGNGSGGFSSAALPVGDSADSGPVAVIVGDFNEDGHQDLAVPSFNSSDVFIYLGDGSGGFSVGKAFSLGRVFEPRAIAVGDLNEDGHQDLAVSNAFSRNASIVFGDGTGSFSKAKVLKTGKGPYGIAVVDFDRDGHQDVITANFIVTSLSVLPGDGTGNFSPLIDLRGMGNGTICVNVGDFNEDGNPDLVTANGLGNSISIIINNTP